MLRTAIAIIVLVTAAGAAEAAQAPPSPPLTLQCNCGCQTATHTALSKFYGNFTSIGRACVTYNGETCAAEGPHGGVESGKKVQCTVVNTPKNDFELHPNGNLLQTNP